MAFIVPNRSADPTSGTRYPANPDVGRYSPIVRATPINSNQQGSPAGGYGDLGAQNLGRPTTGINRLVNMRPDPIAPAPRTRSPPPSSMPVFNRDPVAGTATPIPQRPPSVLSTTSSRATSHAPSSVNGGPGPYRLNASVHSSLV